jgi:hypothetical protein
MLEGVLYLAEGAPGRGPHGEERVADALGIPEAVQGSLGLRLEKPVSRHSIQAFYSRCTHDQ